MKMYKLLVLVLIFSVALFSLPTHAQTLTLDSLLTALTKPRLTSMQKFELIEEYKGQVIKGKGVVIDVLQPYGSKKEAMVQLKRRFRGKQYDIILMASEWDLEKIKKRETIAFKGAFAGMTLETLRFKDVKVIKSDWWPL